MALETSFRRNCFGLAGTQPPIKQKKQQQQQKTLGSIPPCSHGFIALLQIGFITGEESFVGFVKENLKREQETGMKALRFSDENRDKALCSQKETGCRFLM